MNPQRRLRAAPPRPRAPATPPQELLFCAVCQVSIASSELERGEARRTPKGRVFCGVCATSTPEERARRREELEIEFADDAPVSVATPMPESPPPIPAPAPHRPSEDDVLAARVGELERAAFRMQARMTRIEERLDEILRRLP